MNRDRLAARLLATFLGELSEQLQVMNAELLALESDPADPARLSSLFRVVHTLKGAARAAGVPPIEIACHALEALLARARDGQLALGPEEFGLLYAAVDALGDAGDRTRAGEDLADAPIAALARRLAGRLPADLRPAAPRPAAPPPAATAPAPPPPTRGPTPGAVPRPEPAVPRGHEQVRVETEKLDALLASAGEVLMASEQISLRPSQLEEVRVFVARWAQEWHRERRRVHRALASARPAVDALQALERFDDRLRQLQQSTNRLAGASVQDARVLSRVAHTVTDNVRRLRMRPFADAFESLPRIVRDLATSAGKAVNVELRGGDVQADRTVLDGLREALLHLVRNSVDHAIEPPDERTRAGKPRTGQITITAELRGARIAVTVADDGAGLDLESLADQLRKRGIPVPDRDDELMQVLFQGGISTRAEPGMISGRGVGLESVHAAMERIRGSVEIATERGRGTTFTLDCPPALATIRAVLTRVGPALLAFPTLHVERLLRVRPEEIRHAAGRDVILERDGPVPLVSVARLLGPPLAEEPVAGTVPVVTLRAGGRRLAAVVDELLTEQDLVVRPVKGLRTPLRYLSGATLLGEGRLALVLNTAAIVAQGVQEAANGGLRITTTSEETTHRHRILVVDDSITTRALEESILEASGYEVVTAVDGAEAWRIIREQGCDLVVSDIEMPRMDGFALCEAIRASARHRELPVVLVTALESPEHRARGLEAGADAYVAKSSFDQQDLLDTISQLLP